MTGQFKQFFIFDFDDTLVDSRDFCSQGIARTINKFEPEIKAELIMAIHENSRGLTIEDIYKLLIQELNLKTDLELLLAEDKRIQIEESGAIKAFSGVKDILAFLKNKGKKLHICTNRQKVSLIPILKNNQLIDYFDSVISCFDQGFKKPNPTCLEKIIEDSGRGRSEFIYFGDSQVDRDFATNAGIEFIIFDQYLNNRDLFKKLLNMFLEDKMNGIDRPGI